MAKKTVVPPVVDAKEISAALNKASAIEGQPSSLLKVDKALKGKLAKTEQDDKQVVSDMDEVREEQLSAESAPSVAVGDVLIAQAATGAAAPAAATTSAPAAAAATTGASGLVWAGLGVLGVAAAASGGGSDEPSPRVAITSDKASVNEGQSVVFTVKAVTAKPGDSFDYVLSGIDSNDVVGGSLTGKAVIGTDGKVEIQVKLVADRATEGAETVTLSVAGVQQSVLINDSSVNPTYVLSKSADAVDEGQVAVFTLQTTNVDPGATFDYVITGVQAADVVGGALTGTAVIGADGKAEIRVQLVADRATESAESLTLSVAGQTQTVVVNDTSLNPTYALSKAAASVDEGQAAVFTLQTTNVDPGATFDYVIAGVQAADVVGGALTGTAVIGADGKAEIRVQLVADRATEGAESLTLSVAGQTQTVVVNDTSLNPAYALSKAAASVDEGQTAVFTLQTTNVDPGATFDYVITGVQAADVVGGALTGTAVIGADGKAEIRVQLVEDRATESSPESVTLTFAGLGNLSQSVSVVDSSQDPVFDLTPGQDNFAGDRAGSDASNVYVGRVSAANDISGLVTTYSAGDRIDGGEGVDTLRLVMEPGALADAVDVSNIEKLDLRLSAGGGFTSRLDMTDWDNSLQNIDIRSNKSDIEINDQQSIADISITDQSNVTRASSYAFNYAVGVADGNDDTVNLKIDNVNGPATITFDAGIDGLSINVADRAGAQYASNIDLNAAGVREVEVTGGRKDQAFTADLDVASGAAFDSTTFAGDLTLTSADIKVATTGAGDDTLNINGSAGAADSSYNLGEGDNTFNGAVGVTIGGQITTGAGTDMVNVDQTASTASINVGAGSNEVNVSKVHAGDITAADGDDNVTAGSTAAGSSISLGAGQNSATVDAQHAGDISATAGNDTVTVGSTASLSTIEVGDGDNDVVVAGSHAGSIETGDGQDSVDIGGDMLAGSSVSVGQGNGNAVSVSGDVVNGDITFGDGSDNTLVISGSLISSDPGTVLFGSGDSNSMVVGASIVGDNVTFGSGSGNELSVGQDVSDAEITFGGSASTLSVGGSVVGESSIALGTGAQLDVVGSIASASTISATGGDVFIDIGQSLAGDVTVGDGNDELVAASVTSDSSISMGDGNNMVDIAGSFAGDLTAGSDGDKVFADTTTSTASIALGEGNNEVSVSDDHAGSIEAGNGDNVIDIGDDMDPGSSVVVGDGQNTISVGDDLNEGASIVAGDGQNTITVGDNMDAGSSISVGNGDGNLVSIDGNVVNADVTFGDGDENVLSIAGNLSSGTPGTVSFGDGDSNQMTVGGAILSEQVVFGDGSGNSLDVAADVTGSTISFGGDDSIVSIGSELNQSSITFAGEGSELTVGGQVAASNISAAGGDNLLTVGGNLSGGSQVVFGSGNDTVELGTVASRQGDVQGTATATLLDLGAGDNTVVLNGSNWFFRSDVLVQSGGQIKAGSGESDVLTVKAVDDVSVAERTMAQKLTIELGGSPAAGDAVSVTIENPAGDDFVFDATVEYTQPQVVSFTVNAGSEGGEVSISFLGNTFKANFGIEQGDGAKVDAVASKLAELIAAADIDGWTLSTDGAKLTLTADSDTASNEVDFSATGADVADNAEARTVDALADVAADLQQQIAQAVGAGFQAEVSGTTITLTGDVGADDLDVTTEVSSDEVTATQTTLQIAAASISGFETLNLVAQNVEEADTSIGMWTADITANFDRIDGVKTINLVSEETTRTDTGEDALVNGTYNTVSMGDPNTFNLINLKGSEAITVSGNEVTATGNQQAERITIGNVDGDHEIGDEIIVSIGGVELAAYVVTADDLLAVTAQGDANNIASSLAAHIKAAAEAAGLGVAVDDHQITLVNQTAGETVEVGVSHKRELVTTFVTLSDADSWNVRSALGEDLKAGDEISVSIDGFDEPFAYTVTEEDCDRLQADVIVNAIVAHFTDDKGESAASFNWGSVDFANGANITVTRTEDFDVKSGTSAATVQSADPTDDSVTDVVINANLAEGATNTTMDLTVAGDGDFDISLGGEDFVPFGALNIVKSGFTDLDLKLGDAHDHSIDLNGRMTVIEQSLLRGDINASVTVSDVEDIDATGANVSLEDVAAHTVLSTSKANLTVDQYGVREFAAELLSDETITVSTGTGDDYLSTLAQSAINEGSSINLGGGSNTLSLGWGVGAVVTSSDVEAIGGINYSGNLGQLDLLSDVRLDQVVTTLAMPGHVGDVHTVTFSDLRAQDSAPGSLVVNGAANDFNIVSREDFYLGEYSVSDFFDNDSDENDGQTDKSFDYVGWEGGDFADNDTGNYKLSLSTATGGLVPNPTGEDFAVDLVSDVSNQKLLATVIGSGVTQISGELNGLEDSRTGTDVYRFTHAGGSLNLYLSAGFDANMIVFDADGVPVWGDDDGGVDGDSLIQLDDLPAGDYYVAVGANNIGAFEKTDVPATKVGRLTVTDASGVEITGELVVSAEDDVLFNLGNRALESLVVSAGQDDSGDAEVFIAENSASTFAIDSVVISSGDTTDFRIFDNVDSTVRLGEVKLSGVYDADLVIEENVGLSVSVGDVSIGADFDADVQIEDNVGTAITLGNVSVETTEGRWNTAEVWFNDNSDSELSAGSVSITGASYAEFDSSHNAGSKVTTGDVSVSADAASASLRVDENFHTDVSLAEDGSVSLVSCDSAATVSISRNVNANDPFNEGPDLGTISSTTYSVVLGDLSLNAGEDASVAVINNSDDTYFGDLVVQTGDVSLKSYGASTVTVEDNFATTVSTGDVGMLAQGTANLNVFDNDGQFYTTTWNQQIRREMDRADIDVGNVSMDGSAARVAVEENDLASVTLGNVDMVARDGAALVYVADNDVYGEDNYYGQTDVTFGDVSLDALTQSSFVVEYHDATASGSKITITVDNVDMVAGEDARFDLYDNDAGGSDASVSITVGDVTMDSEGGAYFGIDDNDARGEDSQVTISVGSDSPVAKLSGTEDPEYAVQITARGAGAFAEGAIEDNDDADIDVKGISLTSTAGSAGLQVIYNDRSSIDLGDVGVSGDGLAGISIGYAYPGEETSGGNSDSEIVLGDVSIEATGTSADAALTVANNHGSDATVELGDVSMSSEKSSNFFVYNNRMTGGATDEADLFVGDVSVVSTRNANVYVGENRGVSAADRTVFDFGSVMMTAGSDGDTSKSWNAQFEFDNNVFIDASVGDVTLAGVNTGLFVDGNSDADVEFGAVSLTLEGSDGLADVTVDENLDSSVTFESVTIKSEGVGEFRIAGNSDSDISVTEFVVIDGSDEALFVIGANRAVDEGSDSDVSITIGDASDDGYEVELTSSEGSAVAAIGIPLRGIEDLFGDSLPDGDPLMYVNLAGSVSKTKGSSASLDIAVGDMSLDAASDASFTVVGNYAGVVGEDGSADLDISVGVVDMVAGSDAFFVVGENIADVSDGEGSASVAIKIGDVSIDADDSVMFIVGGNNADDSDSTVEVTVGNVQIDAGNDVAFMVYGGEDSDLHMGDVSITAGLDVGEMSDGDADFTSRISLGMFDVSDTESVSLTANSHNMVGGEDEGYGEILAVFEDMHDLKNVTASGTDAQMYFFGGMASDSAEDFTLDLSGMTGTFPEDMDLSDYEPLPAYAGLGLGEDEAVDYGTYIVNVDADFGDARVVVKVGSGDLIYNAQHSDFGTVGEDDASNWYYAPGEDSKDYWQADWFGREGWYSLGDGLDLTTKQQVRTITFGSGADPVQVKGEDGTATFDVTYGGRSYTITLDYDSSDADAWSVDTSDGDGRDAFDLLEALGDGAEITVEEANDGDSLLVNFKGAFSGESVAISNISNLSSDTISGNVTSNSVTKTRDEANDGLGNEASEIFKFVGDDIGEIVIGGFRPNGVQQFAETEVDRLDFSAFLDIDEASDLRITIEKGGSAGDGKGYFDDVVIDFVNQEYGSIRLVGAGEYFTDDNVNGITNSIIFV